MRLFSCLDQLWESYRKLKRCLVDQAPARLNFVFLQWHSVLYPGERYSTYLVPLVYYNQSQVVFVDTAGDLCLQRLFQVESIGRV